RELRFIDDEAAQAKRGHVERPQHLIILDDQGGGWRGFQAREHIRREPLPVVRCGIGHRTAGNGERRYSPKLSWRSRLSAPRRPSRWALFAPAAICGERRAS